MTHSSFKVYIGIPAYNAEGTIADIIRRTNKQGFIEKIIVVNDCSTDNTSEIVKKFKNIILINHKKNTGYGGAQKTIFKKFLEIAKNPDDVIILLHSDGQTLPEEIPILRNGFMDGTVDIVLGSRALGDMGKGKMPLYRIMGDHILTIIQNIGFGLKLSTYASGYRGFRKRALEKIVFIDLNNKHSFDTEIIVRSMESNLKMVEVHVSTIYEGEESRYNLIKYSLQVTLLAVFYFFKRIFSIKLKFDESVNKEYWAKSRHDWYFARKKGNIFEKLFFGLKGNYILSKIDYKNKIVLDCGCGTGVYTFDISKKAKMTVGLDTSEWALKRARERIKTDNIFFLTGDSERLPFKGGSFDIIVNTTVFQYYENPMKMISEMHRVMKPSGIILCEVPYKFGIYNLKNLIKYLTTKKDFSREPINRCYSRKEFKKLFLNFRVIKINNFFNFLLFGIFQKWKNK